jgi:DNA-binding ferritin-like protein
MSASQIQFFFAMRSQIKLYHWQTNSYSRHKATDEVIEKLDGHIDQFVEVYMGKYGRPKMSGKTGMTNVNNLSEKSIVGFIKKCIQMLLGDCMKGLKDSVDSDLFNIRDEMLADLNQLLYLFTLH